VTIAYQCMLENAGLVSVCWIWACICRPTRAGLSKGGARLEALLRGPT